MTVIWCIERAGRKVRKKKHRHYTMNINYRIGEASNPGPDFTKKQTKISDFIHYKHVEKDDKGIWCEEKGIQN